MKKRYWFLILLIFIAASLTLSAGAETKSGACGDNLTWTLDDSGVLTISGTGKMSNYTRYKGAPWGKEISRLEIQQGVGSIGMYAFYQCAGLREVTIPDTVVSIGNSAFRDCAGLTSAAFRSGDTEIGIRAFYECGNDLVFHCYAGSKAQEYAETNGIRVERLAAAKSGACGDNLTWTLDDSGVLTISGTGKMSNYTRYKGAPWGKEISRLEIQQGVGSIGMYAFYQCAGLREVTIPDTVVSIGNSAFRDCAGLTSAAFRSGDTEIGIRAFYDCGNDLVFHCYDGSKAQEYAEANGISVQLFSAEPDIIAQPDSVKLKAGITATFQITANNAAAYQWYYRASEAEEWTPIVGGTSPACAIIADESHNGWQFRCQVTNDSGSAYSDAATLTVVSESEHYEWNCPQCGRVGNKGNYCGGCAHPAPWVETP